MKKEFAIVTGSSGGLGQEIANELSNDGWKIVLHYNKNSESASNIKKKLRDAGTEVVKIQADLSNESGIKMLFNTIHSNGIIANGLVNNSGIAKHVPFKKLEENIWSEVEKINLMAPVLLTSYFSRNTQEGNVVNISSAAGIRSGFSSVSYESSKAALIHATRSMAISLAPRIRVNAVAPGFVKTDLNRHRLEDEKTLNMILSRTPLQRLGTAAEVSRTVKFLMSDDSSFITGETIVVDGGISL